MADLRSFLESKNRIKIPKPFQMITIENRKGIIYERIDGKTLLNIMMENETNLDEIIYVFLTIFLYLLKCPQSLILSALRAFFFYGKPHISRSIFLYFRYQAWLKSW